MVSQPPRESAEAGAGESRDVAAAESSAAPERGAGTSESTDRVRRIEQVLVRCESQLQGLQQRVADLEAAHRAGRKRALLFRLSLLLLLLAAYVFVRSRYAG